jgi:hypothetical protein
MALSVSRGESYWLVSSSGQVFGFGQARNYGSEAGKRFRGQIVGIVSTPNGKGYWLVASTGRTFGFGDAHLYRYKHTKLQKLTGHVSVKHLRGRLVGVAVARLPVAKPAMVTTPTTTTTVAPPVTTTSGTTSGPPTATTPAATPTPEPLEITTTTVPYPVEGMPYSTTLAATGGTLPYTWALAPDSSLPDGLTLSGGTISGTASTSGTYTFTVVATDADQITALDTYLLMVATPTDSYNWSGYIEQTTGAFASASGTFTVPNLDADDASGSALAEWVGIDGYTDADLIQAGVGADPTDGTYAWWEVLPAGETVIPEPVDPDDQISVSIAEITPLIACSSTNPDDPVTTGSDWDMTITDTTLDWTYPVTVCYDGPGSSAEWVVEAPEEQITQHHQTVDEIVPLADFSPNITFTQLSTSTTASALNYMAMSQPADGSPIICNDDGTCQAPTNPIQTATPSLLDSTGFNVAYGDSVPAAP